MIILIMKGGEGFNPFKAEIERRYLKSLKGTTKTIAQKINELENEL